MRSKTVGKLISVLFVTAALCGCGKRDVVDFTGKEGISPPTRRTEEDGSEGLYEIDQSLLAQEYKIVFVNTCGKDIEKLNVTFSSAPDSVTDILDGKKLKDGSLVKYDDMNTLGKMSGQKNLKLSVKAEVKKEGELDFGTIGILDLSDTTIILDRDNDNWLMHMD